MPSFDEILAASKPREEVVRILLDQQLLARHGELEVEQNAALGSGDAEQAARLAQQVVELEAEMGAARVPFRFVGIGYRRWMDLLRDHPPLKGQTGVDHNPDTFPCAAIAASCVDPEMTEEQVRQLAADFNLAQWEALWHTCLLVNRGGDQAPKSVVAGGLIRRRNGGSVTLPTSFARPAASSSAE